MAHGFVYMRGRGEEIAGLLPDGFEFVDGLGNAEGGREDRGDGGARNDAAIRHVGQIGMTAGIRSRKGWLWLIRVPGFSTAFDS